jgi:hypothetical protein
MLNIGCVRTPEFGPQYVNILFDMVRRNLPEETEGRLVCYTDDPAGIDAGVQIEPPDGDRSKADFFLPLNCCVVRPLDCLLEGKAPVSAIYDGTFPEKAAVVAFHGVRAEDCDGWVRHVWKIGGGTIAELTFTPNIPKPELQANIRSAMARNCPWFEPQEAHDGVAVIVGGGASLAYELGEIFDLDGFIFAVNGVPNYFAQNGICPHVHVMLDAHPDCARFVVPELPMLRYYASQCDPLVLDMAEDSLVCWHGGGEAMTEIPDMTFRHIVGGGSTIGTRVMMLAYGLGYRKFHVFGMDSSYDGDVGHAYEQGDYDSFLTVTCGDQAFKTSSQLLGQAVNGQIRLRDYGPRRRIVKSHC